MDAEIFYVLVGAVLVAAVARWRGWPAPLLVTTVALAVSFIPFVPDLRIDGHLLLNIVLPPLLYSASLDVSFVSFRRSMPQIRRLGVGLVVVTTAAVGLIAWLLMPSLTLPGALLLGAIVAPPDAVSAAAIGRRLGLPRRVMTVLSGESLINDATSLTLYRVFAAIVAGATLTVGEGLWQFAVAVVVGVVIGVVAGTGLHQLRMRISDPVVNGTFGLLAPFGVYAITEHLGGSGVLGVVAMGLVVGFNAPRTSYATRQQEAPLWLSADFLLESFVFAYIGLQLPRVIADLGAGHAGGVLALSAVVLVVVIVVRPLFVYPASAWGQMWQRFRLRRWEQALTDGRMQGRMDRVEEVHARRGRTGRVPTAEEVKRTRIIEPQLSWRDNAVVSWAGMRGVVTLATALAASDLAGLDEAASHAIVAVAFVVTVGTLLLQGLTLPMLIRMLDIADDEESREDAEQLAQVRARTREAGKVYLTGKRDEWERKHGPEAMARFDLFAKRMTRVERDTTQAQAEEQVPRPSREELIDLSKGWLTVRRNVLIEERDAGALNEEVMRELIVAMDAEELALDTRTETRGDR
ncbi:CPA1 family monovalent cation:H+ antiporter [Microbacterium resistens]|uniref:CPA1 family monovalent cation:H+ antiporter n=1 Tax=Microbacterium resistens TaxID=156977 RepID=A0ABU1SC17_9MICO|nr:sodium:proton antiporter [Microbacterium resistens]MDR6867159.1 CPA1 family monovalent cation:H+ antiporter [Microbacterium resistens]